MLTRLFLFILVCVVSVQAGSVTAAALDNIHTTIDTCNTVECFMWYWDTVGFTGALMQTAADLELWAVVDLLGGIL